MMNICHHHDHPTKACLIYLPPSSDGFPASFHQHRRRTFRSIFKRRSIIHVWDTTFASEKKNNSPSFSSQTLLLKTLTFAFFSSSLISVVNQKYNVQVHDEYVMSGNTAVLKCQVSVSTTSHMPRHVVCSFGASRFLDRCLWVANLVLLREQNSKPVNHMHWHFTRLPLVQPFAILIVMEGLILHISGFTLLCFS